MVGIEIDLIISDSLEALAFYEKLFDVERIEVTSYEKGDNEAVFTIFDTRIHLLDENPNYRMFAPRPDDPKSVWLNVLVENINEVYEKALANGCTEIQPLTELTNMGAKTAMFIDPYNYIWQLHEITEVVSFEDRLKAMEDNHI